MALACGLYWVMRDRLDCCARLIAACYAISISLLAAGCAVPVPASLRPASPPSAAPAVRSAASSVAAATGLNVRAKAELAAVPLAPPARVASGKARVAATLVTQAGYLSRAAQSVAVALPETLASDSAAKVDAKAAKRWKAAYDGLRQRQVQWSLWCGAIAGTLMVLTGSMLAVFTSSKVEGAALALVGGGVVAITWFAAGHLLLVEATALAALAALAAWMFVGRHHEHVLASKQKGIT